MIGIVFIATAWGRNNGGINSVNTALLKNLSTVIRPEWNWKLFCVVTQHGEDADVVDDIQEQYNITLIKTETPATSRRLKKELTKASFSQLFFVGHDVITGDHANKLRDHFLSIVPCSSIIFHHMDYRMYYYLREKEPAKIRDKEAEQLQILPNADIIVPIGPFLTKSAQDLCKDARKESTTKIHEINPGMEKIEPIQGVHNSHKVILFGRLEDRNNAVKQIGLAIDAIGKYLLTNSSQKIIVKCYGYTDDSAINQKKLVAEICQTAGKMIPITANSYISDEAELFNELASASLCIMPSTYEGFGLTGYEAISAGVPVIISKNTGLFHFLNSWNGKPIRGLFKAVEIHGGLQENGKEYGTEDLDALVDTIQEVFSNYEQHKEMAMELREALLNGECTWDYAARAFVEIVKEEIKVESPRSVAENITHIQKKTLIGLKEYIVKHLLPEFCAPFCDIDKLICKVIKYSNDRNRRFTIFSSHELSEPTDNQLRIRAISDGTVGIMNHTYAERGLSIFPVVISNFAQGQCFLVSEVSELEALENQNIGVPDHQVLAIIAAPLIYMNVLVGALTLDIYDQEFITKIKNGCPDTLNIVYTNMKHFSSLLTKQLYTDIKDDLNFSEVQKMITQREIVSFSGRCPLDCKHCFAKEIVAEDESENDIHSIVSELSGKRFDVVYVSHYKENFFDPDRGVELCEKIYEAYKCDICVTTRCTLSGKLLLRIKDLNRRMKETGNNLSFCISIPALESYEKLENKEIIATPSQRIDFAGQLKRIGITTFVTIRPLFPSNFIPSDEVHRIVDKCVEKVDGILTGGLCANDNIIDNLQIPRDSITYLGESQSEYLIGVEKNFRAVDVEDELKDLEAYCKSKSLLFFKHSMEALNYFKI